MATTYPIPSRQQQTASPATNAPAAIADQKQRLQSMLAKQQQTANITKPPAPAIPTIPGVQTAPGTAGAPIAIPSLPAMPARPAQPSRPAAPPTATGPQSYTFEPTQKELPPSEFDQAWDELDGAAPGVQTVGQPAPAPGEVAATSTPPAYGQFQPMYDMAAQALANSGMPAEMQQRVLAGLQEAFAAAAAKIANMQTAVEGTGEDRVALAQQRANDLIANRPAIGAHGGAGSATPVPDADAEARRLRKMRMSRGG